MSSTTTSPSPSVPSVLLERRWRRIGPEPSPHDTELPQDRVVVQQFNVLADSLSDAFPLVDPSVLTWTHRAPLLLAEIARADADLVALEEVDRYDDTFAPFFASRGFTSIYVPKVGADHGCVLAFRSSRFVRDILVAPLHNRRPLVPM
jgi:mRNA deadenylase 3'-5' endonuclease subunit Ccr4